MVKHVRAVPASAPPGRRRMRKAAVATSVSVVGALLAIAGPTFATPAGAAPISPAPAPSNLAPGNPGTGATTNSAVTVPAGVCRATVQARGGNGQYAGTTGGGGDGAILTATYDVLPGQNVTANRYSGAPSQTAGDNDGGAGGDAIEVLIAGTRRVFAGGGGGGDRKSVV